MILYNKPIYRGFWYFLAEKMQKSFLEILVDKKNEKGAWVFDQILVILHKAFDSREVQENFSFEITKVGNRIRFFVICPTKYKNFLKNQIYAQYNNVEITEIKDYLQHIPDDKMHVWKVTLSKHNFFSIKNFTEVSDKAAWEEIDPFSSITWALWKTGKYTLNTIQINFSPVEDRVWKKNFKKITNILVGSYPKFIKKVLLEKRFLPLRIILFPVILILKFIGLLLRRWEENLAEAVEWSPMETSELKEDNIHSKFMDKLSCKWYKTSINILCASEDYVEARSAIKEIFSTLSVFANFGQNSFRLAGISKDSSAIQNVKKRIIWDEDFILSTTELAGLVHLPTTYVVTPFINWVSSRAFEPPSNLPIIDPDLTDDHVPDTQLTPIWKTNFRGTDMSFGIAPDDRRRHMYIIWKTGMGKSVLLENMIIDDIRKWRWVAVVDPHWDLAESVIGMIPKKRTNQVIIFDPSDTDWPIAFNMLEDVNPEHRAFIASGLVGIFKRIFWDSWGPRLEHTLRNTILALIEYPNTTLISIPLMLTSEVYRAKVVRKITDPVVKKFWTHEYGKLDPRQRADTAGPILNKVGQFLSSKLLRNILGQPKNSFSMRWAMDKKKIIIMNLSKWKIWEDASSLLWAMIITKFQLDAMSRADIPEEQREDFYLYVDEFQNFATDSFATILSEARKYKLNLVMANQYIDQMTETVRWAVFGNVWSLVSFQVWYHDANILKDVFGNDISDEDLMNLSKYTIYLKQLIDGMPSKIFSAGTFPPNHRTPEEIEERYANILKSSRERYSKKKDLVEWKINKSMKDL